MHIIVTKVTRASIPQTRIEPHDTKPAAIATPARVLPFARVLISAPGAAVLAGLFAVVLRALLLARFPFDGLYGQDAYFYLQATRTLAGIWSEPRSLWSWLTSAGTPPVSVWPLGYHLQMALASLLVGPGPLSGQVISLVAGILTPVFTSLLFLALVRLASRRESVPTSLDFASWLGALFAGLVVASSALSVRSSVVVMADMSGVMWATLGALLSVACISSATPKPRTALLAGLCLGIASVTRYIYPMLVLPVLGTVAVAILQSQPWAWGRWFKLDGLLRRSVPLVVPVMVLVGLQLLHNIIHPMPGLPSPVISNWSPGNAFGRSFDSPDGHLEYNTPMIVFFLVRPLFASTMLAVPVGVLGLTGGLALLLRKLWAALPFTLGWWLLFALFYSGNVYQADRFVLSYLPPMAILAGLGVQFLIEQGLAISPRTRGWFAASAILAVVAAGLAGLAVETTTAAGDYRSLVAGKDDYLAATSCVQRASAPRPELPVITFAVTFTVGQYTAIKPHELYDETPESVARLIGPSNGTPRAYLALPVNGTEALRSFEAQWGSTPMGATYSYLRSHYTWKPVSCAGTSFSVFELR